jgi:hypothetical protein
VTPDQLSELDDSQFFDYLDRLDRQLDAPAQVLTEAWSELEIRRARIDARMYEKGAAGGMTREQIDQLKRAAREIFGVRREDEV